MILIVGGLFAMLGLTIVNSEGCSQLVIDTNELHSGIDLPEVDFINCYFDEARKTRISVYRLKLNQFYLKEYVSKFTLVDPATFSGITQLKIREQPTTSTMYQKSGVTWGDKWKYVVEPETGILWVEIVYDKF